MFENIAIKKIMQVINEVNTPSMELRNLILDFDWEGKVLFNGKEFVHQKNNPNNETNELSKNQPTIIFGQPLDILDFIKGNLSFNDGVITQRLDFQGLLKNIIKINEEINSTQNFIISELSNSSNSNIEISN